MGALTQDRKTAQYGSAADPAAFNPTLATAAKLFGGCIAATNASGLCVKASADPTLRILGRNERQVDQALGDATATVKRGAFWFDNSTGADAIAAGDFQKLAYVVDDHTLAISDGGGTRPAAGKILGVDATLGVLCWLGEPSLYATDPELEPALGPRFRARNIGSVGANVASLAAYTTNAGNDGVTNAAGDVIILASQTTAAQNGPYVVGTVVSNAAPLTRPDWWAAASTQKTGQSIKVGGEGTVYKNTIWQAMKASDTLAVDTDDPKFYPLSVSGQTALVAGTFTISVPVLSLKSGVQLERTTANTCVATTGGYHPTVAGATGITPGVAGTGAVVVQACVAAGTINNADISTLNWTVTNQP